jgi:hypothetical protein
MSEGGVKPGANFHSHKRPSKQRYIPHLFITEHVAETDEIKQVKSTPTAARSLLIILPK